LGNLGTLASESYDGLAFQKKKEERIKMDRHGKTVAVIIALLVALYLWWKRGGTSVSTTVAGVPTSSCAESLSSCNAGDFGFTATPAGSAPVNLPLGTDAPDIASYMAGPLKFPNSPFPVANNTLDTGGLGTIEHVAIAQQANPA
jgi:hypothetical protein